MELLEKEDKEVKGRKNIMNILIFNHSPGRFGTFYRCHYLAKYLSKMGHKVTLVKPSNNKDYKIIKEDYDDDYRTIQTFSVKEERDYISLIASLFLNPWVTSREKPDIVHGFAVTSGATAAPVYFSKFLRRFFASNIKTFSDIDDLWGKWFSSFYFLFPFFERLAFNNSDGVTVTSDGLAQRAIQHGASPNGIYYIPNGANIDNIKPITKEEARRQLNIKEIEGYRTLLFIGHTGGSLIFLNSLKYLFVKRNDIKVLLVGDFPREVKEFIYREEMQERVLLMGRQPFQKIPLFCGVSDILIFPMIRHIYEETRSPITLYDYMASGRPIVSNAVGESRRVIEENDAGVLTDPDSPQDFADKIDMLLDDEEKMEEMGKKARMAAEKKLSWQVVAKKLEEIYKKAIAK